MPKYRVRDQLHVSALGPDTMGKGTVFAVSKAVGDDLVKRELVDLVDDQESEGDPAPEAGEPVGEKAETAPQNKAEPAAPANKAVPKRKPKAK